MNRICKKHFNNLVAYIDGELSERKQKQIDNHIKVCSACREEIKEMRQATDFLLESESIIPSSDYDSVFWEKIENLKANEDSGKGEGRFLQVFRLLFNQRFPLAASVVFVAFVLMTTLYTLKPNNGTIQPEFIFTQDMELLCNLNVIEQSDALENFEVITLLDILAQETNG